MWYLSLSFLIINQMLPLSFIYIKGRLHLNEIVLKIELSC